MTDALSQTAQGRALVLHEADVGCQQPCIHGQAQAHDCMAPQEVVQEPKEQQQVCHDIRAAPSAVPAAAEAPHQDMRQARQKQCERHSTLYTC